MAVARLIVNFISSLILFVVAIVGAFVPSCLWRRGKAQNGPGLLFHLGNILSAGVMLSAGLCHLLPPAIADIQPSFEVRDCTKVRLNGFPMATFLCGLGLILALIIDQIAEAASFSYGVGHCHNHSHGTQSLPTPEGENAVEHEEAEWRGILNKSNSLSIQMVMSNASTEFQSLECQSMDTELTKLEPPVAMVPMTTTILLFMAFSVHSMLEGAALGAQMTIQAQWNIMFAILAHKGLSSYALGASLAGSKMQSLKYCGLVLGFSLSSPVGIMSGYALSQVVSAFATSSLSALASGTFLYVAVFEVIPKELAKQDHKFAKLSAMTLGFGLMSMLAIWTSSMVAVCVS